MTAPRECLVHATAVAIGGSAALLRGPSGSGKSDLALRFVSAFAAEGACLVADDQTVVCRVDAGLEVRAPGTIAGLIEVRGVGAVSIPHGDGAALKLLVDLAQGDAVPRMPPDPPERESLLGCALPVALLAPFEASAPIKLKLLLTGAA